MELAEQVYRWTPSFPKEERYGLVSQVQRAATSVPMNIAEGWGLGTTPQYLRHCRLARGSLCELETSIELAVRVLRVESPAGVLELRDRCSRIVQGLIVALERKLISEAERDS
jgi:four helix bundle protein